MNPLLDLENFVPDVEARVFDDTLYLYGSYDIQDEKEYYCSHCYHVFSSKDGIHFKDHGVSFSTDEVSWSKELLFAPDCICKNGIYYLYFCTADRTIGVASSDKPYGPFTNAKKIDIFGIDPGVLLDEDGSCYLYWGQGNEVCAAKLKEDMCTIDENTLVYPLDKEHFYFHEGSSMRKKDGIYYYVYADESRDKRPTCLGYATSKNPLGPFKYQGVIVDNKGCDPQCWNNHGSIASFKNQWYVFYHRSTNNSKISRRVCSEKISFDDNGLIPEVKMTSKGLEEILNPLGKNILSYASMLDDNCYYMRINDVEYLKIIGNATFSFSGINLEGIKGIKIKTKNLEGIEIKPDIVVSDDFKNQYRLDEEGSKFKLLGSNLYFNIKASEDIYMCEIKVY